MTKNKSKAHASKKDKNSIVKKAHHHGDLRAALVEAGVEHGCDPYEEGVKIFPFPGTFPEGSHELGHYYMEKEKYMQGR